MTRRTATDFSGDGGGNPFAAGSPPSVGADQDSDVLTPNIDTQMMNSQTPPMGGDDLPVQTPDPTQMTTNTIASLVYVGCLRCGHEGYVGRVTASMRCQCGSTNLVFEAEDQGDPVDRPDWQKTDEWIQFSSGLIGYVRPENDPDHPDHKWHWTLEKSGNVMSRGWAYNKTQAKGIVELQAPMYQPDPLTMSPAAASRKTAEFPPKKDDDDKKKDDDKKSDDGAPSGPPKDDAPPAGAAPPAAPTDPAVPGAPADPTAPPAAPGAPPVDPTAPGGTDPMDQAQAIVDAAVDQVKNLGHDAKEVAYDVDALFSEWRCKGCELEGRADVAEDGTANVSGDLFESMDACPTPVAPEGQEAVVPPAPLPPGAPAADAAQTQTNPAIPPTQQQVAKKKWWQRRKADRELNDERNDENEGPQGTVAPLVSDRPTPLEQAQDKIGSIAERVLESNPGMNRRTAVAIAQETVRRYPSLGR